MPDRDAEIALQLQALNQKFQARDEMDAERRKTDDARYDALKKSNDEVMARVDGHGLRTTALETKWAAFFGDEGAFKVVVRNQENQGKKIDRLSWFIAGGIGLLAALQFIIPILWSNK